MKKSIFYLPVLGLLMFYCNADAQTINTSSVPNWALGVRGGISIPNLSASGSEENPLNTGYSSRFGPDAGVFAEFKFTSTFSIQPMVEYSSQGGKKNGLQAFPTPDAIQQAYTAQGATAPTYLYANYKSEAKLNYLMIPVLAKFGWNLSDRSHFRAYVDAGPFLGFLLNAKQVTSGSSQFYADNAGKQPLPYGTQSFDNTQNIKPQLNTTDFGIEGNIGLAYRLVRSYVFVEIGGNYGFLNIQKGTDNGKNNTGAGTGSIGYAYWF